MLDYNDPNLVLIKSFRGCKKSFFQINSFNNISVVLKDIQFGTRFEFKRSQLERHIEKGILKTTDLNNVPEAIILKPVTDLKKLKAREKAAKKTDEELERKYKYVQAALHSSEVPAYTAKWLVPWTKKMAAKLNDKKPPSWRILTQWINNYVKSGWNKEALRPRHDYKGNRYGMTEEGRKILNQIVREFTLNKVNINYSAAHREYVARIEKLNESYAKEDKPLIKPVVLRTLISKFKGFK